MLHDLKNCLIVRLSKDVFSFSICTATASHKCDYEIVRRERRRRWSMLGEPGSTEGAAAAPGAVMMMMMMARQTGGSLCASLQLAGRARLGLRLDWSLHSVSLPSLVPQDLPCNVIKLYGISDLPRGNPLMCSPWLHPSGVALVGIPVRMLMCRGRSDWGTCVAQVHGEVLLGETWDAKVHGVLLGDIHAALGLVARAMHEEGCGAAACWGFDPGTP